MTRVKGWCPSAHAPMMSGDGLLVRIKPRLGRVTSAKAQAICALAERFGNGMIDVTSRANLQIRGVNAVDHAALLKALIAEGLVDPDPTREARQSMTVTPYWQAGDLTDRLGQILFRMSLPELPDKMGIALDTGERPVLQGVSGDFRFECTEAGDLVLRADGATKGRIITEQQAEEALRELANWFLETGGAAAGRMARHLKQASVPLEWQQVASGHPVETPAPVDRVNGHAFGVPFGQSEARALSSLLGMTGASHLRVTPWRVLILESAAELDHPDFLSPQDRLMSVSACPGKPACAEATVPTRKIARTIASKVQSTVHVSGCGKGCARQAPANLTVVGRNGRFDLVRDGRAGDTPDERGLTEPELMELLG